MKLADAILAAQERARRARELHEELKRIERERRDAQRKARQLATQREEEERRAALLGSRALVSTMVSTAPRRRSIRRGPPRKVDRPRKSDIWRGRERAPPIPSETRAPNPSATERS